MTKRILSGILAAALFCAVCGVLSVGAAETHSVTFTRRDGATMTWQVKAGNALKTFPEVPEWIKDEEGQVLVLSGWLADDGEGRWWPYHADTPVWEDLNLKPRYSFGIIAPNDAKMVAYVPEDRPELYLNIGRDAWIGFLADGGTRSADQLEWYLINDDIARLVEHDDGRVSVIGKTAGSTFLYCYDTVTGTTTHRYLEVVRKTKT